MGGVFTLRINVHILHTHMISRLEQRTPVVHSGEKDARVLYLVLATIPGTVGSASRTHLSFCVRVCVARATVLGKSGELQVISRICFP